MPIFDYRCNACGALFSRPTCAAEQDKLAWRHTVPAALMASHVEVEAVRCPRCRDIRVEPLLRPHRAEPPKRE